VRFGVVDEESGVLIGLDALLNRLGFGGGVGGEALSLAVDVVAHHVGLIQEGHEWLELLVMQVRAVALRGFGVVVGEETGQVVAVLDFDLDAGAVLDVSHGWSSKGCRNSV
jgi:hypothetical protein